MKNLIKVAALVLVIGFASCTDENDIVPTEKEQQLHEQELFGTNKEDSTTDQSGGAENPTMDED